MNKLLAIFALPLLLAGLSGCGGGGGGGAPAPAGPVTSTLSFPLQSGMSTLIANGYAKSFTISGTCSGSGTRTNGPATTATTFEGVAALSAVITINYSYTNCTPATTAQSFTAYYNSSSYLPLGMNSVGVNYGVYLTPPTFPTSVTVGGTGIIGTLTLYTDSTKTTGNGRVDGSYVVTADTSTTALVTLIGKVYNAAGTLIVTEQSQWRIVASGALTPISVDLQFANGSTNHLVWTYN